MGGLYLDSRLEFLRTSQNPDGGWGYFPGKESWFEPTTYAMLALHGTGSDAALDRAWDLVRTWQRPDGSFQPSGIVRDGTWVTAYAVTLGSIRYTDQALVQRAVDWLLQVAGVEHSPIMRAAAFFHMTKIDEDLSHQGWPWRPGNASWVEPTTHTLVALKKLGGKYRADEVRERISDGEKLILSRRCTDGGWNYGTPNTLNVDLPSYPSTTGLGLVALEGYRSREYLGALALAQRFCTVTKSSLGRAWLRIGLACHGIKTPAPPETSWTSRDVMLAAIEALAHPEGNHTLFCARRRV